MDKTFPQKNTWIGSHDIQIYSTVQYWLHHGQSPVNQWEY